MMGSLLPHVLPVALCWVPCLPVRFGGLNYFLGLCSKNISHMAFTCKQAKQSDVLRGRSVQRSPQFIYEL